ncbi:MAG: hypothetical protein AABN95_12420 [Acidobacteriota bacterium]
MPTEKTNAGRAQQQSRTQGLSSLNDDEKGVLSWNREKRFEEFQKVNRNMSPKVLEAKLLFIDTITIENGEILDTLRINPTLSWEKVRDMFMGGPVDGYTSTFHNLEDIQYPEHFWKATIENERGKLS